MVGTYELIFIAAVIGLVILLLTTAAKRASKFMKYDTLVRRICVIIGLLLFGAVGLGTMLHLKNAYRTEAAANRTVLVPTMPRPAPPALKRYDAPFEGRFLLQSLVLSNDGRIVHAETHDLTWPQAKGKTIQRDLHNPDATFYHETTLNEMKWQRPDSNTPAVVVSAYQSAKPGAEILRSSINYHFDECGPLYHPTPQQILYSGDFFSLNIIHIADLWAIDAIIPVQKNDPLTAQSAYQFLNQSALRWKQKPNVLDRSILGFYMDLSWTSTPRLIPLILKMGPVLFTLLIGAFLVARFFRRKVAALAAMLFIVMLYIVALDRIALDRHLQILSDANQPYGMRTFACWNAASTFFHHGRTEDIYDRLMRDAATSPELRPTIQLVAQIFQEPKLYDTSRLPAEEILSILLRNKTPRNEATLADLQNNCPLYLWFREDGVIVALPEGGVIKAEGRRMIGMTDMTSYFYIGGPGWPEDVIYKRFHRESDGAISVEFSLEDQLSIQLGLEKGIIWSARFTKQEFFENSGLRSSQTLHEKMEELKQIATIYSEEKIGDPRLRMLLAHAGVVFK
jgi:hypothetical protein